MNLKELKNRLESDKKTLEYNSVFEKKEPLVTVTIATYNRGQLLVDYSLRSLLDQTYKNLQIIVIGDCCTDDTEERISKIKDSRVYYENLKERGKYPSESLSLWQIGGVYAANRALELAKGDFIAHLDDDDAYIQEKIELLVDFIKTEKVDAVYHPFYLGTPENVWSKNTADLFEHGKITTSSVFYHSWFKRIEWNPKAYEEQEPGDWNRYKKFKKLGATTKRFPAFLHYKR